MSSLPLPAALYVGSVIAVGAAAGCVLGPRATFDQPVLFATLLVLSAVTSAFKVSLPLAKSGSTMSVSYAVDFAALLMLGPHETMLVAVASAWSQCTFRMKTRNPLVPNALQHGVPGDHGAGRRALPIVALGGVPGSSATPSREVARPLVGAATAYFIFNTVAHRRRDRPGHAPVDLHGLESELPLERAELLRRRRRRASARSGRCWARASGWRCCSPRRST